MWEILGGVVVGAAVSGVFPLVNAEMLVVVAAAAVPALGVPLVAAASTLGQMTTKCTLFALARRAPHRLPAKARRALHRASTAIDARGGTAGSLVFTSAATGLPPFMAVSVVSGAVGMRFGRFVLSGGAGRLVRFGLLAWAGSHFGPGALELLRS